MRIRGFKIWVRVFCLLAVCGCNAAQSFDVVWSSYIGGDLSDTVKSVCFDSYGNLYLLGETQSPDLATGVQYGKKWKGQSDIFVSKINRFGELIWTRYLGGEKEDTARKIIYSKNSLYILGNTISTNIATSGYDENFNSSGLQEGFLAKLSPANAKLLWSTYIGGEGADLAYDLTSDLQGNLYVGGLTSSKDFKSIATLGTHKGTWSFPDDVVDGFIVKIKPNGKRDWGTYYGGPGADAIKALAFDPSGHLIGAGVTTSNTHIATYGTHIFQKEKSVYLDTEFDAFIVRLNPEKGSREWATYYGVDFCVEEVSGVCVGTNGEIFLATYATNSADKLVTDGSFNTLYYPYKSGIPVNLIASFSRKGRLRWGSYLAHRVTPHSAMAVRGGKIYVVSRAVEESYISLSEVMPFDFKLEGYSESAFYVLNSSNGTLKYFSYLGGNNDEFPCGLASGATYDGQNYVAIVGNSDSTTGLATNGRGEHQSEFSGGQCDGFITLLNDPKTLGEKTQTTKSGFQLLPRLPRRDSQ